MLERAAFFYSHSKKVEQCAHKDGNPPPARVLYYNPPNPLFSLALLTTWHALIHDHCDDRHGNNIFVHHSNHLFRTPSTSHSYSLSLSFNPHIVYGIGWLKGEFLSPVPPCLWMKRAVLTVFHVVCRVTLDLSLLSGFPLQQERNPQPVEERSPGSQAHWLQ